MHHSGHHAHHAGDEDWASRAAHLTLEAEVLLPYVAEVASWAVQFRRNVAPVRRVLDVGSGPGVIACELARIFPSADVVAADASPELLDAAAARAVASGVSGRVETRHVDLSLGLAALRSADVIWMAMVLHHMDDQVSVLRNLREALEPGGLLILIEHGDPLRFLPDGAEIGRPGLIERLSAMDVEWLATMWDVRPGGRQSNAGSTVFNPAGLELIEERMIHIQLPAPLPDAARQVVRNNLQRKRDLYGERLDEGDRAALDALIDEENPQGIMQRDDAFLDASRHVYVARNPAE